MVIEAEIPSFSTISAISRHSPMMWRTGQDKPKLPFEPAAKGLRG
jgi:hypothetical protein